MIRSPRIARSCREVARRIGRIAVASAEAKVWCWSTGSVVLRRRLGRVLEVDKVVLEALDRGVDDVDLGPKGLEGGEYRRGRGTAGCW